MYSFCTVTRVRNQINGVMHETVFVELLLFFYYYFGVKIYLIRTWRKSSEFY